MTPAFDHSQQVLHEVVLHWQIQHKNLVPLKGIIMEGEIPLIVMPYLAGGRPVDVLTKTRDPLQLLSMVCFNLTEFVYGFILIVVAVAPRSRERTKTSSSPGPTDHPR